MTRPLSQLIYSRYQQGKPAPTLLTFHGHNAFAAEMREIGLAINPAGNVTGVQSSKGVYIGRAIAGYTWFLGPLNNPSPVHFGDSLAEIERFLWDEVDRQAPTAAAAELPMIVGQEQGASMVLATAGAVPDLLSAVIAINPILPIVHGWEPPLAPLDGLPILLVNPRSEAEAGDHALGGTALVATLEQWGGVVTVITTSTTELPAEEIATWVAQQPVRQANS